MRVDHVGLWSENIELLKDFYTKYFNAKANKKYVNTAKSFESYFLSFENGSRLEIMQMPGIVCHKDNTEVQYQGFVHLAVSVGSTEQVVSLTKRLRSDGFKIVSEPRRTGDGYFESVVFDPENNRIEITE